MHPAPVRLFWRLGLAEPGLKSCRTKTRVVAGCERFVVHFQAEVGGLRIRYYFAWIFHGGQITLNKLGETYALRVRELERAALPWCSHSTS